MDGEQHAGGDDGSDRPPASEPQDGRDTAAEGPRPREVLRARRETLQRMAEAVRSSDSRRGGV